MDMKVEELEGLFRELDGGLKRSAEAFLIGGAAIVLRGQRPATVDVDLIAPSNADHEAVTNALKELGFIPPTPGIQYEDPRGRKIEIDVGGFRKIPLSARMMERGESAPIGDLNLLKLMFVSNEDNVIFKSMGEREKDLDDIHSIISGSVDWEIILEEAEKLTEESLVHQEVPTLFPGFVAVSLKEVTEKYGGISENVIKKFEQLALRLNEEMIDRD